MSNSIYTKAYTDMRGVDLSSERSECDPRRFNALLNMWRDYRCKLGAAVETAPGFRSSLVPDIYSETDEKIHALHWLPPSKYKEFGRLIVHKGKRFLAYGIAKKNGAVVELNRNYKSGEDWNDSKSSSVYHYGALYVVDGKNYKKISFDKNGDFTIENAYDSPYIPTTFSDGDAYEQRNLFTPKFVEKYTTQRTKLPEEPTGERVELYQTFQLHEPVPVLPNKLYAEYETEDGKKIAYYYLWATDRDWLIPSDDEITVWIDGKSYTQDILTFEQYEGIGVTEEVNSGLIVVRNYGAPGIPPYEYSVDFRYVVREDENQEKTYYPLVPATHDKAHRQKVTWETDGKNVLSLKIGGEYGADGGYTGEKIVDGEIKIHGEADPAKFAKVGDMKDVLTGNPDMGTDTSAISAILGCTLITEFEGRLFFSGNPKLPNTLFYTQRNMETGLNDPSYVGAYNYINDGTGNTPIVAMMTTPTQLIVLKDHSPQGESIYYHTAQINPSTNEEIANLQPLLFPREEGLPGLGCFGVAVNFADDPCFITKNGLDAVGKSQVNLERTIVHRSSSVDAWLMNEDLRNAFCAEWEGYLLLFTPSGRVYLADSRQLYSDRQGGAQYEWYVWDDIGVYHDQGDRYKYITKNLGVDEIEGRPVGISETGDYVEDGLEIHEDDGYKYVVKETDGVEYAYIVDTYGEKTGGTFHPATAAIVIDDILFFGTEGGDLCVFNTETRDDDGYFPQDSYHRNNRGYKVYCVTKSDNCGRANLSKRTVRGSFVLKCKSFPTSVVDVNVRTDKRGWHTVDKAYVGVADFGKTDFDAFSFSSDDEYFGVVRESEKKWVEKQIAVENWCFNTPFGFISATYDFTVQGKVKIR